MLPTSSAGEPLLSTKGLADSLPASENIERSQQPVGPELSQQIESSSSGLPHSQAWGLQQLANEMTPDSDQGVMRWLIHSATGDPCVSPIRSYMNRGLESLGWNPFPSNWTVIDRRAEVSQTDQTWIDMRRMPEKVLVIFVLDANPVTLVNTYSQVKNLTASQSATRLHLSFVVIGDPSDAEMNSVDPQDLTECGNSCTYPAAARKLILNCQRFLGFAPTCLGTLPDDPMIRLAADDPGRLRCHWSERIWGQCLFQIIRRGIMTYRRAPGTQGPGGIGLSEMTGALSGD